MEAPATASPGARAVSESTMHVLVTGATGFTGWHAAARLVEAGHRVRALVRDPKKAQRLLAPLGLASDDLVVGSMIDADAVGRALEGCDAVIHAAAVVSVTRAGGHDAFADNLVGTQRVVGGAYERGIEAVVCLSSLTTLFEEEGGVAPEAVSSRYARSKLESDFFVRSLQARGARIASVYPAGILGPDDPGRSESMSAYRGFLQAMIDCEGGTQFVDVRDLALLLERLLEERASGHFVAAGEFFEWSTLRELIEAVTGAHIRRIALPGWVLRAAGSLADRVRALTGKRLLITREGMEIATRWRPITDSPEIARLGVGWRDPSETLADVYRWFLDQGRIPARIVPALATPSAERPE